MKKRKMGIAAVVLTVALTVPLTACGNTSDKTAKGTNSHVTALPEQTYGTAQETEATSGTGLDSLQYMSGSVEDSMAVIDGKYWDNTHEDDYGEYHNLIPLLWDQKRPDIYDLEDQEADMENYGQLHAINEQNAPDGTEYSESKHGFLSSYLAYHEVGYGEQTGNDDFPTLSINQMLNSYTKTVNGTKTYYINQADVGCITFALYENFYEQIPTLHLQIFGVQANSSTDLNTVYQNYVNGRDTSLTQVTDMNVAASGVYYIDYRDLEAEYGCNQFICVLQFEGDTSEYSYCVNGRGLYDVTNEAVYQNWKAEHVDQLLGE